MSRSSRAHRRSRPGALAAALVGMVALAGSAGAQQPDLDGDGSITTADLAEMKSRLYTSDPDADLDGSGTVDFLDMRLLKEAIAEAADTLPMVGFSVGSSEVEEGRTAFPIVEFDSSYSGPITFEVTGNLGLEDFQSGGCTALARRVRCTRFVSGSQIPLFFAITDDALEESLEFANFRLLPTLDYTVDSRPDHTLTVRDNDGVWHGVFQPDPGESVGSVGEFVFALRVIRTGASPSATLEVGEGSLIPADGYGLESFSFSDSSFSASLAAVPVASSGFGGTPATFSLDLLNGAVERDELGRQSISGSASLVLGSAAPHLARSISGTFSLERQPTPPAVDVVVISGEGGR